MSRDLPLLARYAEGLFWMARYLERVENLARLVDVTQTFESPGREAESWFALIRINADEDGFAKRGAGADRRCGEALLSARPRQPDLDPGLAGGGAHQRAHAAPADLHRDVDAAQRVPPRHDRRSTSASCRATGCRRLCARIKEGVQAHTGITEGTFFRDQGWLFYQLGRLIERADQTTRLLDIRYHLLVPAGSGEERRVAELTQWGGVLRGRRRLSRLPPGGAARLHAVRRGELPADRPAFPAQRGAVRASRSSGSSAGCAAARGCAARSPRWNGWRSCAAA